MTNAQGRHPVDLLLALGCLSIAALCGVVVHPNQAPQWEQDVFEVLNSLPGFLYWPMWVVMQFGNLLAAPIASVAAAAFRRWRLAVALLLATVAKIYGARLVKDLVTRDRPASVIDHVVRRDAPATGEAFVSGHAIVAFAITVLVVPYLPRRAQWIAWTLAAAVCIGRVYVGAHLPLDIVAGAAIGLAVGLALRFALGTARARATEPTSES